jgi:hypothetical protein
MVLPWGKGLSAGDLGAEQSLPANCGLANFIQSFSAGYLPQGKLPGSYAG